MSETIDIAFGRGHVTLDADADLADWVRIRPRFESALPDPRSAFRAAVSDPVGCCPLGEIAAPGERVVIATSDGTRPVPNRQLIPWIVDSLGVPDGDVTVLVGTGTHRPNTEAEIAEMFGSDTAQRLRIVNHDAYDTGANVKLGTTEHGTDAWLDRLWVEADKRIVVGFIEPHFFAGFSGGAKGVAPGVAGIDTILRLHRAELIGHQNSTWGVLDGNRIQEELRAVVALCPPDFMVNVTLNAEKRISGFYVGHYGEAHRVGCEEVRGSSMQAVDRAFPVVVTSNSGYPLDQNLYQTVKGISAAARVVADGGTVVVASECSDGVPAHGNFADLMREGDSPEAILCAIDALPEPKLDQWQAQVLAGILCRARVAVFSKMDAAAIRACKMQVTDDIGRTIRDALHEAADRRVAVLPDGPLTIPYVA